MSVNSSSFADLPLLPSNSSFHSPLDCFISRTSILIFSALSFTNILLLPVLIFVLYLGHQRWRKQHSAATTSHSDHFTYHCIVMKLSEILGFIFFYCGGYIGVPEMELAATRASYSTFFGQALFHVLTCVERYLAVVHPVTYLGLRHTGGVRIRNISIGCVWLLTFGLLAVMYLVSNEFYMILFYCIAVFFLTVISFCSISVLCALKRPGPGEVGGNRERVDQSKQRAFRTIMAVMGVLLFRFGGDLIATVIDSANVLNLSDTCVIFLSSFAFDVPSSLVLPLLYLHRAGKLPCCKQNTESG